MFEYILDNFDSPKLLDLGCFTGGRLIAWSENYRLKKVRSIAFAIYI